MDKLVVAQKMESLRRCIERIRSKTPSSAKILSEDIDLQDIITVNISRAVQRCVDIGSHLIAGTPHHAPKTMAETFSTLAELKIISLGTANAMKKAVGFRNIAAHCYEDMNWNIVFAICTKNIDDFKLFAKEVSNTKLN